MSKGFNVSKKLLIYIGNYPLFCLTSLNIFLCNLIKTAGYKSWGDTMICGIESIPSAFCKVSIMSNSN